jgi:membrane-associated phospholipid phosphatase
LIVSTNAPLIDSALSSWDRALGFDWQSLFAWMRNHLLLRHLLQFAYASLLPQIIFTGIFLGFTARFAQLITFIKHLVVTCLSTLLLSGLFPAAGAWKFYGIGADVNAQMVSHFGPLRDGTLRTINLLDMQGLISIPSFHTVLAILIASSMWRTPVAYVFLVLDMATIISTPIEGGHYLVDVLAGALLAGSAIFVTASETRMVQFPGFVTLKQGN